MRNYSSRFRLPNGKWAYIQLPELADDAKTHIHLIKTKWPFPENFFHLRKGGHIAAIRQHLGRKYHGKVDLSNFFGHVTRHRITRSLKSIGYSFHDAESFAIASTVCVDFNTRRFALPYGFVQSPILASLALDKSELGNCIRSLSSSRCTLSVYVDDIIISGDDKADVANCLKNIHSAARTSNFIINTKKSIGPSVDLRAFNIDFNETDMEITTQRFEEMCRDVLKNGAGQVSDGLLGYVTSVNLDQAEKMLSGFPNAFPDQD